MKKFFEMSKKVSQLMLLDPFAGPEMAVKKFQKYKNVESHLFLVFQIDAISF